MTSQPTAFITLQDTVVSPHPNKLLNHQFMVHNTMALVWPQFTQQTICWLKAELLHCQISIHSQETIGKQPTKMQTIQEHQMTSQPTAFITLEDTAVSPHQNKLLNQVSMDHNITALVWQPFTQLITCCLKCKPLHFLTSTHSQGTTGKQLIKMLITQELQMISQLIAFTMLEDIVVSPHPSKLLNHQFMVHNTMTLVWLQFTQQTIC